MPNKSKIDLPKKANCILCNKEFRPKRIKQKFCTPSCRWIAWSKEHPRKTIYIEDKE